LTHPQSLARAPITEALVDIRATPSALLSAQADVLSRELAPRFPRNSPLLELQTELRVDNGAPQVVQSQTLKGLRFDSQTGDAIVQLRDSGFTYNRLKEYTDGASLIDEALDLWGLFVKHGKPESVSRVALRYINTLEFPEAKMDELGRFLVFPPACPTGLGIITEHGTRCVASDVTSRTSVIVTQSVTHVLPAGGVKVVLDVDAFRLAEWVPDPAALRPTLDTLRGLKNVGFFGMITKETVERYK